MKYQKAGITILFGLFLALAFALGGLAGSGVTFADTLSKEIDHDLGVVCYWTVKNNIFCIPLNQTNYEEE